MPTSGWPKIALSAGETHVESQQELVADAARTAPYGRDGDEAGLAQAVDEVEPRRHAVPKLRRSAHVEMRHEEVSQGAVEDDDLDLSVGFELGDDPN